MNATIGQLASRYDKKTNLVEKEKEILENNYHISAFINPDYPIITRADEIQNYKWGLIPFWVKPKGVTQDDIKTTIDEAEKIRKGTYNSRAETIFEKPSFRTAIEYNRCLIPSTGYFEYHHNNDTITPYFIFLKETEIFSIAGVYDEWVNPDTGELIRTFSMITTEANELAGWIHNGGKNPGRMPVILSENDEKRWLNKDLSKKEINALLRPYPAMFMDAYIVCKDFYKKNPHDRSIIERLE